MRRSEKSIGVFGEVYPGQLDVVSGTDWLRLLGKGRLVVAT
jgi:hypothetical protein